MTHPNGSDRRAAAEDAMIRENAERIAREDRSKVRILGSAISEDEIGRGYAPKEEKP